MNFYFFLLLLILNCPNSNFCHWEHLKSCSHEVHFPMNWILQIDLNYTRDFIIPYIFWSIKTLMSSSLTIVNCILYWIIPSCNMNFGFNKKSNDEHRSWARPPWKSYRDGGWTDQENSTGLNMPCHRISTNFSK